MKRCIRCDQSKHNRCLQGGCECPCQFGDNRKEREDWESKTDPSQDKFFEDMKKKWRELKAAEEKKFKESKARAARMS